MAFVSEAVIKTLRCSHQSRSHATRQLTNKLNQLRKISIVAPKAQKFTAHSTCNMTQIPTRNRAAII